MLAHLHKPRGTLAQRRSAWNRKYYQAQKVAASEASSDERKPRHGKSMTPSAVNKREQRLRQRLRESEEKVKKLEEQLRVQSRENAARLLIEAAEAEENLAAVLQALEWAQGQLAARDRQKAGPPSGPLPLDFRTGPHGAYATDFVIMCTKVVNHGASPSFAGDVIKIVTEFITKRPMASVPSDSIFRTWVRESGIVAEAVVAQKVHEHMESKSTSIIAMSIDQTSKFGVSLHGASLSLPSGLLTLGVSATATKSTEDQLAANQRLRDDVSSSGEAVFGLPKRDVLMDLGGLLSDSGATEEKMRRILEEQKKTAEETAEMIESSDEESETENGKDEKDEKRGKRNETELEKIFGSIIKFVCHKHKISNVTSALAKLLAAAFQAEYEAAKGFRQLSPWGHNKGAEYNAYCESKSVPNDVKSMHPTKHTRQHLRLASMPHLFLAAPHLVPFIKSVCARTKRPFKSKGKKKKAQGSVKASEDTGGAQAKDGQDDKQTATAEVNALNK